MKAARHCAKQILAQTELECFGDIQKALVSVACLFVWLVWCIRFVWFVCCASKA
jgi:hypothetical protein